MWQPRGVWCVSCRRVLADAWLELSHKTPEPLSAQLENTAQPAGTPGSTRAMKELAWEGAGFEQTLHLFRTGKEPGACLCQVFYSCCAL